MIDFSRRDLLTGLGASAVALSVPSAFAQQRIVLNDASRLNPVPVAGHWIARTESEADVIARLRKELKDAAAAKRPVCVSAARHSMGGQSLPRNGQAITLDLNICEPDRAKKTFRVHAGTRWFQVIEHLDRIGFSPAVMQSNSDFGVASTFSVNAHGWPVPYGPFGATVRSLRLMLADGTIVTCSRSENPELFGLAMGGYGLVGVILDIEVDMVENLWLRPTYERMPANEFAAKFYAASRDPNIKMMYGRLNVAQGNLLQRGAAGDLSRRAGAFSGTAAREPRWRLHVRHVTRALSRPDRLGEHEEAALVRGERCRARHVIRPRDTEQPDERAGLNLEGRDHSRTDILHEYSSPPRASTSSSTAAGGSFRKRSRSS